MRWRFRSRLKSSRHLAAARGHNPGGRFLASCCIRAIGQERKYNLTREQTFKGLLHFVYCRY